MGGAVSVELNKPLDASDIKHSNELSVARNEVIRLRSSLGHLAKNAGYEQTSLVIDASDLCLGINDVEDFDRCINEIVHIRRALQLSTLSSRRSTRHYIAPQKLTIPTDNKLEECKDEDDSSSSSCSRDSDDND